MAAQQQPPDTVQVELTVWVPRDSRGDLHEEVSMRLDRIDGVTASAAFDICGIHPSLNDLTITVQATLIVATDQSRPDPATVEAQLADAFGVKQATVQATGSDVGH